MATNNDPSHNGDELPPVKRVSLSIREFFERIGGIPTAEGPDVIKERQLNEPSDDGPF